MGSSSNKNLNRALKDRNDEFYTRLEDIERELIHYKKHFENKIVYCNCDDPKISNFFHYFSYNFEHLKLKKLYASCYKSMSGELFSSHDSDKAVYLEYSGNKRGEKIPNLDDTEIKEFKNSDGDFQRKECIELLKKSDIVVTNPPFSLFREYVAQLIEYEKKFLIIGNFNAIKYKEIFPLFQQNKIWIGNYPVEKFDRPDDMPQKSVNAVWYTNLEIKKHHEDIMLTQKYYGNEEKYPKYRNYDAINVDEIKNIPIDYDGPIGVPITFLRKYNPDQFEIIGLDRPLMYQLTGKVKSFTLNNKELYSRIIIRHKRRVSL